MIIPAPSTIKHWNERAMQKHYRYLEGYKSSGIKIDNDEKLLILSIAMLTI